MKRAYVLAHLLIQSCRNKTISQCGEASLCVWRTVYKVKLVQKQLSEAQKNNILSLSTVEKWEKIK